MNNKILAVILFVTLLIAASVAFGQATMQFTVSMTEPNNHLYHVEFRCEGIKDETIGFKMPAWTPGYYRIMNFAQNVKDFVARDVEGKTLEWEKAGDNIWRVKTGEKNEIVLNYDVEANNRAVAASLLNSSRGYISPTSVFMHVVGWLDNPVTVTIELPTNFRQISTGLDPVEGRENTFTSPNFDTLYDCPIFIDDQQIISFEVQDLPHQVAIVEPGELDRQKLVSILKRMIDSAVSIVSEIPYKHYTFIMMGRGQGGLEHSNSMAVYTRIPNLDDPNDYKGWLSFIAHEFFHLYNVKRIRPIALGPFDMTRKIPRTCCGSQKAVQSITNILFLTVPVLWAGTRSLRGLAGPSTAMKAHPAIKRCLSQKSAMMRGRCLSSEVVTQFRIMIKERDYACCWI